MFTHGFSEGEGLSSSAPRLIPLPDENPPAMALLCHILHFRTGAIPMERDVAALAELAILCDKYDCAGSVKPWSLLWIAEWLPCVGQDGFEKLLFITYGLDLPDAFSKVTKALVESHHGQLQFDGTSSGYEILPEGLTGESTLDIQGCCPFDTMWLKRYTLRRRHRARTREAALWSIAGL
jgi:hypothetical protein